MLVYRIKFILLSTAKKLAGNIGKVVDFIWEPIRLEEASYQGVNWVG